MLLLLLLLVPYIRIRICHAVNLSPPLMLGGHRTQDFLKTAEHSCTLRKHGACADLDGDAMYWLRISLHASFNRYTSRCFLVKEGCTKKEGKHGLLPYLSQTPQVWYFILAKENKNIVMFFLSFCRYKPLAGLRPAGLEWIAGRWPVREL